MKQTNYVLKIKDKGVYISTRFFETRKQAEDWEDKVNEAFPFMKTEIVKQKATWKDNGVGTCGHPGDVCSECGECCTCCDCDYDLDADADDDTGCQGKCVEEE